jgi:PD-(D/E)XK nuclease superfamily
MSVTRSRGRGSSNVVSVTDPVRGSSTSSRSDPLPMLRTSERSAAKRCEWMWDHTYNHQLRPVREAPALRFGTLIHKALAGWYVPGVKRGVHPREGFEAAYNDDMQRNNELFGMYVGDDERWENAYDVGIAMMDNYVEEYLLDLQWDVIATEMPFEVTVTYEARTDKWPYSKQETAFQYVGVIDGCWRHRSNKSIWIPDHKTTAGIGPSTTKHLALDDQAGAYWSYGVDYLREIGILKKDQKLAGMLYNFMRKAIPDERQYKLVKGARVYLNLDGTPSKKQPSPYFLRKEIFRDEHDRNEARRRALIDWWRLDAMRKGELPMSKNPGQFTCSMCSLFDACELHETGNDYQAFIKQTMETWDPYSEHSIEEGR